jgi:hypothetical protein
MVEVVDMDGARVDKLLAVRAPIDSHQSNRTASYVLTLDSGYCGAWKHQRSRDS